MVKNKKDNNPKRSKNNPKRHIFFNGQAVGVISFRVRSIIGMPFNKSKI
jgi:hypothetical protein